MSNSETFELTIAFGVEGDTDGILALKGQVIEWLREHGEESFVEGAVDNIEVDYDYDSTSEDQFNKMGGDTAPISIYKYTASTIDQLATGLAQTFGTNIKLSRASVATDKWLHGWKENFRPFATRKFVVYPPWIQNIDRHGLLPLVIEPGVAFGTGHHATTRLCLAQVENIVEGWQGEPAGTAARSMLDIGTGTGILAIAALKLGIGEVLATDIDMDAVKSAQENAACNGVKMQISQGSVPAAPHEHQWDLVMANILAVVLRKIFNELALAVAPSGRLVLAGLLTEDQAEFEELASAQGLVTVDVKQEAGWACLVFGRR